MRKLYVVIDIGCLECGTDSTLAGTFTTSEAADALCETMNADFNTDHKAQAFTVEVPEEAK